MTTHAPSITTTTPHVGLTGCGMYAGSKLSGWPELIPAACLPGFLPSIYTFSTSSTELLEIQGILNVPRDVGFLTPASSRLRPGRTDPVSAPSTPIGPHTPENSNRLRGPSPVQQRHRMSDPMVEAGRPGMSALGQRQRPSNPPSALPCLTTGHRGVTAPRVAARHPCYRTRCDVFPDLFVPGPDRVIRRGGGPRKNTEYRTVPPYLAP